VQRIVKRLVTSKKSSPPVITSHLILRSIPPRQRHQAHQNFSHAAAYGRGINHLDAPPAQRFRERAKFLDLAGAQEFGIVVQWDARESQCLASKLFLLSRSISRSSLAREPSNVLV